MWILRRFSKDGFSAQFLTQRFSRSFSKDFPPIFRDVEVWLVQKFQINFSIFTHFMRNFGSMSYNGKSIGEVAENRSGKFRFSRNVANAFCQWLNYKKSQCKKHWRHTKTEFSIYREPRHFANAMFKRHLR